ncbi:MAG: hypothetical protein KatS3mg115_0967 [Candidatus Poribacteria bacterium]|nr:MAG: hypothetical protein KatS3mg115_0967 [Candidatus Poribacteria bacterium]
MVQTPSVVSVLDYGAVGDGRQDETEAFQAALDAVGEAGGGLVQVPRGKYRFEGTLRIPVGVTLEGTFRYAPAHAGLRDAGRAKPEYGSLLLPYAGHGEEEGPPFITIQENATLRGVAIYYPEQPRAGVPVPYPWTVALRGNNPALLDVELLNPYQAIDASANQRHLIRNVHGQPLRRGVLVDAVYDIGRIENVHWNPWFSMEERLFQWQMEHGEAFIFGRTDWQYVLNTFCFGYRIGYRFIETENGVCNGNFLGIGADDCWVALQVDQCAPMGLLITNGEFVSFHGPDPTMVVVSETHRGSVRLVNCAFWGPNHQIARIAGRGTVGFSDCTFMQWDRNREGRHAIQAVGGTILLRGNEFRTNAPQVELGEGVERAVIVGNVFTGTERIRNRSAGSVQIGWNASSGG